MNLYIFLILLFSTSILQTELFSSEKIRVLYNSLNTKSVSQHLAFYQLYPDSPEGMKALRHAWHLLSPRDRKIYSAGRSLPTPLPATQAIISLVNKTPDKEQIILNEEELWAIEELASFLPNRRLKGYDVNSEEEVLALPPEEIDLARGLFLSEMGNDSEAMLKIRSYEAMIDLMALQILAKISMDSPPRAKIAEMNHFIFEEMGFRFPPHSLYAKDVDLYTFLPSVLDSRRGICLGVSILYLCLSQRLNLELETITPPGHIYVRYHKNHEIINIETTARGIDLECEAYLSVNTRSLQERTIKEVIGLAHINEASAHWQKNDHLKALECYDKALPYLPGDKLIIELMAYNYILTNNLEKGKDFLEQVKDHIPDYSIEKEVLVEDLLLGNADAECIKAVFTHVDENRGSVLNKKQLIEQALEKNPKFRSGYFCLASIWLQLHRPKEALSVLKKYSDMRPQDPTAHYYLSIIYAERLDYNQAWEHLRKAERLVKIKGHNPKALKEVRKTLRQLSPE